MQIKKGQLLNVKHQRSGNWKGIATRGFDTDNEEFYPIALAQEEPVTGKSTQWIAGDNMPCRNSLCTISVTDI